MLPLVLLWSCVAAFIASLWLIAYLLMKELS